jgi:hypothetical protein
MSGKYSFHLQSRDRRRDLPPKLIVGQRDNESNRHVLLKLFGYLLFYRPRLHVEANLHDDNIPFEPDLVELDYHLRPALWVECGECGITKLSKLAAKVPGAEVWILKRSFVEAQHLLYELGKAGLRRGRYNLIGLDEAMFEEVCSLLRPRNTVLWVAGGFDPPYIQFDFNGLWFEAPFEVHRF